MNDFDVAEWVPIPELTDEEASSALGFTWVFRRKGSEVRARLCVRGLTQPAKDLDSFRIGTSCGHVSLIFYPYPVDGPFSHATLRLCSSMPSWIRHRVRSPFGHQVIVALHGGCFDISAARLRTEGSTT